LAAHSNSACASGHCLVTDATLPPLPAAEEVAIEEKTEEYKAAI
jgi:hypothetical protein